MKPINHVPNRVFVSHRFMEDLDEHRDNTIGLDHYRRRITGPIFNNMSSIFFALTDMRPNNQSSHQTIDNKLQPNIFNNIENAWDKL